MKLKMNKRKKNIQVVIFALLNKKKSMHAATLIAITFGIVGLRTY